MKNRKYFPFERNSYYFGKLLTARDFEAEQRYMNDKRRLQNRLLSGNGIVAGLGVVMVDDTSIVLQAGCAYDAGGREIVVPETKVVKLSTIEGYKALKSDCAYLGIRYEEYPMDEVHAPMGAPGEQEAFNKLQESYELELVDESQVAKIPGALDEFVTTLVLYADNDLLITQKAPKYVQPGADVALIVEVRQVGHGVTECAFTYHLDASGFAGPTGSEEQLVTVEGLTLQRNESRQFSYTFTPKPQVWGGGEAKFAASGFAIKKNGESFSMNQRQECELKPVAGSITDVYLDQWYGTAMDKELADSYDQRLWIARIDLFRQKNAIIIDKVYPAPFGQFSYNAQQMMQLRRLEDYYPATGAARGAGPAPAEAAPAKGAAPQASEFVRNTACGVFDLGLGLGYSTREAVFSDEIMHGLGKGPVYVQVGIEYITAGGKKNTENSEILLGDINLFAQEGAKRSDEQIFNVSTAVKVLPERGTFIVAVQPKEASGLISLRIRWYAMRMNEISKQIKSSGDGEKYIIVNPDTVILPPKGTAQLSPVFINMPTEACTYKMVDPEGGSVSNSGLYTAPAKEGVYEIRVEAISDPTIFTHVFAIVTQKSHEDAPAEAGGKKK